MGFLLAQRIKVTITVEVDGDPEGAAAWTVQAGARSRLRDMAGLRRAVADVLADASGQAMAHTVTHADLAVNRGAASGEASSDGVA